MVRNRYLVRGFLLAMLPVSPPAYAPARFREDQVCRAAREYAAQAKQAATTALQETEARGLCAIVLLQEGQTRLECSQAALEATLMTIAALQVLEAVTTQPVWRGGRGDQCYLLLKRDGVA
jgi:hypothetical protein